MIQVHEATYVPHADGGGEMQTDTIVGDHKITAALPVGENEAFLSGLLDELMVRVEKIGFLSIAGRREIHLTMGIGARQFETQLPLDENGDQLTTSIDLLLETVRTSVVKMLQTSFAEPQHSTSE